MRAAASRISESNLSERLEVQGDDEFAELGRTFNGMVGRLEKSFADLREAFEDMEYFTEEWIGAGERLVRVGGVRGGTALRRWVVRWRAACW